MEDEAIVEPTQEPPADETPSSSLIVEQSDIDKVFAFPVFEQIENVDSNITDVLAELKKLNDHLIPTEEELLEMEALEAETLQAEQDAEALALEEEVLPVEETEEPIDYMKLMYEEMQTQNALNAENHAALVEQLDSLEQQGMKTNEVDGMVGVYLMYLIPLAVVVSMGSKILNPFTRG